MGTLIQQIADLLLKLDVLLTGHQKQNSEMVKGMVEGIDVYYLSDGGYSRIGYNELENRLYLTSTSLEKTRQRWDTEEAKELRHQIESKCYEYWQETQQETSSGT